MLSEEEEEEGFYKILPANTADHMCQSWQSCSNHHEVQTVYSVCCKPCHYSIEAENMFEPVRGRYIAITTLALCTLIMIGLRLQTYKFSMTCNCCLAMKEAQVLIKDG